MRSDFDFGMTLGIVAGIAMAFLFAILTQIEWVSAWQTLIAGGVAIIAAYITVQPARKQLGIMSVQSSIMARDTIAKHLNETEARTKSMGDETKNVLHRWWNVHPFDPDEEIEIDAHWAHATEQMVRDVRRLIAEDHARLSDPSALSSLKIELISDLQKLASYLSDIHRPESSLPDDEELSDAQIAEIQKQLEEAADVAREELGGAYSRVSASRDRLMAAFKQRIADLRTRLRQIDDLIVDQA